MSSNRPRDLPSGVPEHPPGVYEAQQLYCPDYHPEIVSDNAANLPRTRDLPETVILFPQDVRLPDGLVFIAPDTGQVILPRTWDQTIVIDDEDEQ